MKTSSTIYQYDFKQRKVEGDLTGSAIGGVDMLLSEILASKGHIKEIDHGEKKITFNHGETTACMLITSGSSEEFKYRLEMFHLSFEKQFYEYLTKFSGNVTPYAKSEDLIREFFLN
ncbi:MAG: hypothetical protein ACFFCS_19305 [Candidatus Hodarchaeota archaeon]